MKCLLQPEPELFLVKFVSTNWTQPFQRVPAGGMENKKSGKFPPSALIKAVGENLPAHLFYLFFI